MSFSDAIDSQTGASAGNAPAARDSRVYQAQYTRYFFHKIIFMFSLFIALILLTGYVVTLGPFKITMPQVYAAVADRFFPGFFEVSANVTQIVWNIRLPRIIGAVVAGLGFGACGAVMQAVLMNPLASPFTLGISAGAQFGVAVAAVTGLGILGGPYLLIGNAFFFAMLCSGFIIALSLIKGASSETLILAGIAVNYFFTAMSQLFKYFATDEQLRAMVGWGMGDLSAFSWSRFPLILGILVVCIPILMLKAKDLNIMTTGDETAKSLGLNANRLRLITMTTASLLIGAIVCFTGTIGFIGLVSPHMARIIIGVDHKLLIPTSSIIGALVLLCADAVGLNVIGPTIIPTGIMTSLLGVPFFLWLILKGKRREFWS